MSGKRESVLIQLREGARETIQNNRKKLCSITEIIVLCGQQNMLSVVIVIVAQIWKVYKQQAQTITTFVHCSTFVSRLETQSLGTTFRVQLEMPHTHPLISRFSWLVYLVTIFVMQSYKRFKVVFSILGLQIRSLIAPTRKNSALSQGMFETGSASV